MGTRGKDDPLVRIYQSPKCISECPANCPLLHWKTLDKPRPFRQSPSNEIVTVDWPGVGVNCGEVGGIVPIKCVSAVPQVIRFVEPERDTNIVAIREECGVDALLKGARSGHRVGIGSVPGGILTKFP